MYTAMAASVAFQHIVMADLVPANIREVRKWVDAAPDAKDWTPFAKRLAVIEGHADVQCGAGDIIARTRNAICEVTLCDISKPDVLLGPAKKTQFDAVVACLCLDSGSVNQAAHEVAVANLTKLIKPGGVLVACGVHGKSQLHRLHENILVAKLQRRFHKEFLHQGGPHRGALEQRRRLTQHAALHQLRSHVRYSGTQAVRGKWYCGVKHR
ncbi:hypothetical protein HPB51_017775 [Rhipicephalus microplus]|uniref:Uncharacterized protein n=1 Tax=Rhipicephalus microplus TaxID=6941 RepID=A0A9J6EAZ7_RHIMP|nr:hypothetical protein HPB51_017775 [Rhipicephalus microplus]